MSKLSICKTVACLALISGCGKKDNDKSDIKPLPQPIPNSCKAMVELGTWPGPNSVSTWVYGCFEGYEPFEGKKSYLAHRCMEASPAPGFQFVDLQSTTCPMAEATSVCEGETFKIVAYQQDAANFNLENFRKYCESKQGILKIIQ